MGLFTGNRPAKVIAAAYLLLVLITTIPLIKDLAIHHGNGIAFLAATILTSPFSWLFFWLIDKATDVNAFYVTGWLYVIEMLVIFTCGFLNAAVIFFLLSSFGGRFRSGQTH
jgi:hypothetical protein